jgi:hypothetical protein
MVLVAAVVAALALVPVVAAYLQFGYGPAVADPDPDHGSRVARALDRIADEAAEHASGVDWADRDRAVQRFRNSFRPRAAAVERARLGDGVVVRVTENATRAATVACPRGRGRSFGACDRVGGVVVQDRAGETVVVAVAVNVRVTTPDGTTRATRVVRPR